MEISVEKAAVSVGAQSTFSFLLLRRQALGLGSGLLCLGLRVLPSATLPHAVGAVFDISTTQRMRAKHSCS